MDFNKEIEEILMSEGIIPTEEVSSEVEEVIEDDVLIEIAAAPERTYKVGDAVKLIPGATYASGGAIANNLLNSKLYVRSIAANGNCSIGIKTTGRISGSVNPKNLIPYEEAITKTVAENSYLVLVKVDALDIKSRPDINSKTLKTIHRAGLFTVVEEKNNWGHLKIGGWIPLDSVKKITA